VKGLRSPSAIPFASFLSSESAVTPASGAPFQVDPLPVAEMEDVVAVIDNAY